MVRFTDDQIKIVNLKHHVSSWPYLAVLELFTFFFCKYRKCELYGQLFEGKLDNIFRPVNFLS